MNLLHMYSGISHLLLTLLLYFAVVNMGMIQPQQITLNSPWFQCIAFSHLKKWILKFLSVPRLCVKFDSGEKKILFESI